MPKSAIRPGYVCISHWPCKRLSRCTIFQQYDVLQTTLLPKMAQALKSTNSRDNRDHCILLYILQVLGLSLTMSRVKKAL